MLQGLAAGSGKRLGPAKVAPAAHGAMQEPRAGGALYLGRRSLRRRLGGGGRGRPETPLGRVHRRPRGISVQRSGRRLDVRRLRGNEPGLAAHPSARHERDAPLREGNGQREVRDNVWPSLPRLVHAARADAPPVVLAGACSSAPAGATENKPHASHHHSPLVVRSRCDRWRSWRPTRTAPAAARPPCAAGDSSGGGSPATGPHAAQAGRRQGTRVRRETASPHRRHRVSRGAAFRVLNCTASWCVELRWRRSSSGCGAGTWRPAQGGRGRGFRWPGCGEAPGGRACRSRPHGLGPREASKLLRPPCQREHQTAGCPGSVPA